MIAAAGIPYPVNFLAGWSFVLLAFLTGAAIGLGFHRRDFLGGYDSFRRRIIRLGHICLAALGMMNVIFALAPLPEPTSPAGRIASAAFLAGGVLMPAVCFLTGWREGFRHLFFLPVLALVTAVVFTLLGALP